MIKIIKLNFLTGKREKSIILAAALVLGLTAATLLPISANHAKASLLDEVVSDNIDLARHTGFRGSFRNRSFGGFGGLFNSGFNGFNGRFGGRFGSRSPLGDLLVLDGLFGFGGRGGFLF